MLDRERILAKIDELEGYLHDLRTIAPDSFTVYPLLSAKFSWSNSLGSWFQVSRDKICATFNVPRGTPESLSNGEPSLDFTYYEQATNHFRSPHLAENRVTDQWANSIIHETS